MRIARSAPGVVALTLAVTAAAAQAPDPATVTLKPIKYAELGKYVRGLTGKVVVVNFWAEY